MIKSSTPIRYGYQVAKQIESSFKYIRPADFNQLHLFNDNSVVERVWNAEQEKRRNGIIKRHF